MVVRTVHEVVPCCFCRINIPLFSTCLPMRTLRYPGGSQLSRTTCGSGTPRRGCSVFVLFLGRTLHVGLSAEKVGRSTAARTGAGRADQNSVVCVLVSFLVRGTEFSTPSCLSATARCWRASRRWSRVLFGTCEWLVGTVPFVGRA